MSEMAQNPASAITAPAPTVTDLLFFSNLSPERWFRLSEAERADWTRRYIEAGIEPGEIYRVQGRGRRAK
ncbi:hypothetical protein [Methylosinus sp. KRF6]|uniref:hypothetical protein n=1 Tax=Methylosinus sp. KRF6 TaxID=2846853 RepID=UPI001C0C49C5|nr:hypothetical protein [Methylosinus sp. KRF6]MBU3887585.1 hypothetical protein [Methylosinus sp. KRF6]